MKHDNSEWTEEWPFIKGTLCDKDGNEIRSDMTEGLFRCADTKPSKPGDYCIMVEMCFSAMPEYMAFDGENWERDPGRSVWWFGGEPDGPLHTLSKGYPADRPKPQPPTLQERLKAYKDKKGTL